LEALRIDFWQGVIVSVEEYRRRGGQKFSWRFLTALIFATTISHGTARAALLPPYFVDSAVSLGVNLNCQQAPPGGKPQCVWGNVGTGFEYGYLLEDNPDQARRRYAIFLITARHVVCGPADAAHPADCTHPQALIARLNPSSAGPGREFLIPKETAGGPWHFHPNPSIDVAVLRIEVDLQSQGLQSSFIVNNLHTEGVEAMKTNGLSAGDGVFVVGFPTELTGAKRNYPIVRQGAVARINDMFDRVSNTFLIDSFIFPGNSGGPVFSKPEVFSIGQTKNQASSYLIGMVLAYKAYTDAAVSPQTGQTTVTREENSGLAEVLPTDYIEEAIKAALPPDGSQKRSNGGR
jgi:hypothetical protein